jgi:glyoxylase-like metal-dependent hydrolase (beta-lactamase superfamily II)
MTQRRMTQVHTIDLEYLGIPGAIASYVVDGPGGPVMIETGPGNTTAALERGLAGIRYAPSDVKHVFVTHVHFDHAGASGWMAAHGAHVYVHEFGRRHLIDPSRLLASARRIYGDRMEALWGELRPIPPEQTTPLHDGDTVTIGGLRIRAIETPGHARHHHAFVIEDGDGRIGFTGDAAAMYMADCPEFVSIPTPPPEFELSSWIASLRRLEQQRFDRIYPTHFGEVLAPREHLERARRTLRTHAMYVRRMMDEGLELEEMAPRYIEWFVGLAEAAGAPPEKIGFFVKDTMAAMNVVGMHRYWSKLPARLA